MITKQRLESLVRFTAYATFFVPLIVAPSSFIFPFIVPKIVVLRSLILLMGGLYALLLVADWQRYRPRATPLAWAVGLFFASFGISTFAGVDPYHSFWDNHERMLGFFTVAHYAVYFFICSAVFTTWAQWRTALRIFFFAGAVVMAVGMIQVVSPHFLLNQGDSRVIGTLGNAIYMGGYGLFLLFVAAFLALREDNRSWKIAYAVMGLLGMLGLFFSGTRGSVLGLFAALVVCCVAYGVTVGDVKIRRGVLVSGVVLIGITALLYAFRTTSFVMNIPAVGRAVNTSWTDFKASPRYIAWDIALQAWKQKPVFGWGPNNYYFAFNQFYNPRSLEFGYGETWFDNAHNIIVNTMAVQGTVGIVTYLGIFVVVALVTFRAYRKGKLDRHTFILGCGFLVAHVVQNVTVFENITSYLYFVFWLAFLNRVTMPATDQEDVAAVRTVGGGTVCAVATLTALSIFVFNVQPARANRQSLAVLRALAVDPSSTFDEVERALAISHSPHIDDIRSDISRSIIPLISSESGERLTPEMQRRYFGVIYQALEQVLAVHPLDIRVHFMMAQLLQNEAIATRDARYLEEAESVITKAVGLSVRRQQLLYMQSVIKMQLGKNEEAVRILEKAKSDNPLIGETYWRMAFLLKIMDRYTDAEAIINEGRRVGARFNDQDEQIIAQIMVPPPRQPATTTATGTAPKRAK